MATDKLQKIYDYTNEIDDEEIREEFIKVLDKIKNVRHIENLCGSFFNDILQIFNIRVKSYVIYDKNCLFLKIHKYHRKIDITVYKEPFEDNRFREYINIGEIRIWSYHYGFNIFDYEKVKDNEIEKKKYMEDVKIRIEHFMHNQRIEDFYGYNKPHEQFSPYTPDSPENKRIKLPKNLESRKYQEC